MEKLNPYALRQQAGESLQAAAYDPRKLVLIHTAVSLGSSLLAAALSFVLNQQIAGTGGLSGIGLRSILSTIQAVLELAVSVALPFWNISLAYAALQWIRREPAEPSSLLQGFRRFGTVFGARFFVSAIFMALAMAAIYISTTIFLLTPFSKQLLEVFEPILQAFDPNAATMTQEELEALLTPELLTQAAKASIPMFVLFALLFAGFAIPLFYRLRFVDFFVMDGEGVLSSVSQSVRMTRGRSLQVVKLDLHFWWFYLLQLLTVVLCYGDTLLPLLGIALPFSADVGFFLFYALGCLLQCLLLWRFQATVSATFAHAYEALE